MCQPRLHILGKIQEKLIIHLVGNFISPLKACRERGNFKILPIDGARTCRTISLLRKQLGLVREEGQIMDHCIIKGNQEYV